MIAVSPFSKPKSFKAPANLILADCNHITPDLLTLVTLNQEQIDKLVEKTPGGAANIQDIYPLGPLQEGFLFHHLLSTKELCSEGGWCPDFCAQLSCSGGAGWSLQYDDR